MPCNTSSYAPPSNLPSDTPSRNISPSCTSSTYSPTPRHNTHMHHLRTFPLNPSSPSSNRIQAAQGYRYASPPSASYVISLFPPAEIGRTEHRYKLVADGQVYASPLVVAHCCITPHQHMTDERANVTWVASKLYHEQMRALRCR